VKNGGESAKLSANIRDFRKKGKTHVEGREPGAKWRGTLADRARGVTYDGHVQFDLLTPEAVARRVGGEMYLG